MSIIENATRRFATPSVTGRAALLYCIIAVAVPTLLRASVDGIVTGLGFTPYVPFVLIAAIFLEWYFAAAVALVSALIGDAFFTGPPVHILEEPSDVFGMLAFLSASTIIIGFAHLTRRLVQDYGRLSKDHLAHSGIVFSLEDGQALASWYGPGSRVCLGTSGRGRRDDGGLPGPAGAWKAPQWAREGRCVLTNKLPRIHNPVRIKRVLDSA